MNTVRFIKQLMDKTLFVICVVIMVALVIDVSWQVLSRYAVGEPSLFTDEAARYLMVWMTFLGGAYMFGADAHLSVTSLRDMLPKHIRGSVIILTYVLISAFAIIVMFWGSQRLITRTMAQPSPSLGIPMGLFYSILPISAVCIVVYMIINILEYLHTGEVQHTDNGGAN